MNFRNQAVEFVRKHNCACHTPVELIEKAMEVGAMIATERAEKLVKDASKRLNKARVKNLNG